MLKKIAVVVLLVLVIGMFWLFEGDLPASEVDAKYTNTASAFLTLDDGTRLHYRDEGHPDGAVIMLLHGSNASLHTWEPWVARLGDRYRMVSLDLPGHGLTGRTPSDDYSTAAYIAVVKSLVEHLALTPVVLAGNSMGGGVTWRYTLAHPEDVAAMILVDASGPQAWRASQTEAAEANADMPLVFSLLRKSWFQSLAGLIDPYYLVVQGLKASHFDPDFVDDSLIARYYELSMRKGTRAATVKRFSSWRGRQENQASTLNAIQQPTLILWGEHDALIPASNARRFELELRNAQAIIYPNVGHIPMEEAPDISADDVHRFLQNVGIGADKL